MKRWYKKNFYFNELNNKLIYVLLVYAISAGGTYLAYKNGVIIAISIEGIQFAVESLSLIATIPFIVSYMFLQLACPALFSFLMFAEYYKNFSTIYKIRGIVPVSNKSKVIEITKSTVLFYILYLSITYITNINMDVAEDNSIFRLTLLLFTALCAIIVDILCRESNIGQIANLVWIIITVFVSINSWNLIFSLLENLTNVQIVVTVLLIICSILEFSYILRKIDNIKISEDIGL